MYQYEYETVSCDFGGWGFGSGNIYGIGDYQSIINRRAEAGWRYVGYMPTKQRGTGHIQELDLIRRNLTPRHILKINLQRCTGHTAEVLAAVRNDQSVKAPLVFPEYVRVLSQRCGDQYFFHGVTIV